MFQHPELKNKVTLLKREVGAVDVSVMNEDQQRIFSAIARIISGNSGGLIALKGTAGAGKTFLTSRIIEWFLLHNPTTKIAFTATTNAAVEVSYKSTEFTHPCLAFATIHSLLALKEIIKPDGTIDFAPDKYKPATIGEYRVVFIDESSQFSTKLWQFLSAFTNQRIYFIFIGDHFQTPPVGEANSLVFTDKFIRDNNVALFELTKIVRQAENNPIIKVASYIRTNIHRPLNIKTKFANTDLLWQGDLGVEILKTDKAGKQQLDEVLRHVFTSANFKDDANYGKVVCWRNKTVAALNSGIRRMIYGKGKLRRIEPGEKIIARKPIFDEQQDRIIINNGKQMEVVEFSRHEEVVNDGAYLLPYYDTLVRYEDMYGISRTANINIPTDLGMIAYLDILDKMAAFAKSFKPGSQMAGRAWTEFYSFMKQFAEIQPFYAGSVHTAQGGTFNNTIVIEGDISKNWNTIESNKILYTACTRASERLWII